MNTNRAHEINSRIRSLFAAGYRHYGSDDVAGWWRFVREDSEPIWLNAQYGDLRCGSWPSRGRRVQLCEVVT